MPIIMQVSEDRAGQPNINAIDYDGRTLYMETTHVGHVLSVYERNGYNDSDFCAIVWDEKTNAPITIEYATTRGWSYANNAVIDATPEVLAKYKVYKAEADRKRQELNAAIAFATPKKGSDIEVISKRGKNVGKSGRIFWLGAGFGKGQVRVGVQSANGETFFIDIKQVKVVGAPMSANEAKAQQRLASMYYGLCRY